MNCKKNCLFIIFIFTLFKLSSQNNLTINFNEVTKLEAIELIESKSNYRFYFVEKWLDNTKVSGQFDNKNIYKILEHIFGNSSINYFILNNKIILSNGQLIRRPNNFQTEIKEDSYIPLVDNSNFTPIGKEEKNRQEFYYISGVVKNLKTNKPIEGATIFEREKNIVTTTNDKGYYKLKIPYGKNNIETSFIGHSIETRSILLLNNGTLNFYLDEEGEKLDEVVINSKKNRNLKETVASIVQIKAKDIKTIPQILGERDLLKAVTTLPGIKSAGEGSEGINVRGGKVDQNLFLLDQGVIYNPTHFLGLFSAINPFTTESVNVYKANTPIEYDGRLSSVFEMNTKDANTTKLSGEASIGPVTGNLSIETPIIKGKSGLLVGARSTYSNWILSLIDDDQLSKSSVSFYDAILKYNHEFNKNNTVKVTGYHSNDQFQIATDSINTYSNTTASINWFHKFNNKHLSNFILSTSNYNFGIKFEKDETNDFDLKYKVNETGLKFKFQYLHSKQHQFNYGVESKLYNISPGTITPLGNNSLVTGLNIPNEKGLEAGIFISDNYQVNKKLAFDFGLRFSKYLSLGPTTKRTYQDNLPKNTASLVNNVAIGNNEIYNTYEGLSYRLSARYLLNNNLSVKGGVNKSFQYIHRLSNNTTASPLDTWRLSDHNIKPQEGLQLSLGLFQNFDNSQYEVSLEGYYKKYENLTDFKTGANLLLNETIETEILQGPGKSYGAEFLIRKKSGKLNGWLGYSYSRSLIQLDGNFNEERVNNGQYFPTNYDKPHNVDVVLNYKLTERYSISSNFSYQSGRPITYPSGKFISQGAEFLTYSNRNQFRIPDYFRLDIGFNIEGNHKIKKLAHSFWNISIYNVLGRNNPYSIFFETVNGNVTGYKSSIFSTPIPTITYNLKF